MATTIDTTTYPKSKAFSVGHGYSRRAIAPSSVIVHSTNNPNKNTFFTAEAKFLFESDDVSAHYLVGKTGRIVEFLDPRDFQAWHAGETKPDFVNARSVGIELHHSAGDPPYPKAQLDALTWLVRGLMARFRVALPLIDTHRAVALPKGRKSDPSDWIDADFYRWRATLDDAPTALYRVIAPMWISETPSPRGPVALDGQGFVWMGDTVVVDEVRSDGWCHLANHTGFLPIGGLEKL